MDDAGVLVGVSALVGVGVLVGVITCWGDWKGVGLASTEGEGVECVLLWAAGSVVFWHAESSSKQINAMINS
jgi:hypothetical protein